MTILREKFQRITIRLLSKIEKKCAQREGGKVIYVTSAADKEGKSFVSNALAIQASEITSNKVLLIDANMETPSLHENFGLKQDAGLSELLISGVLGEIKYQQSDLDNLYLLPAGKECKSGLLFKQRLIKDFLEKLKAQFDLIIIDAGSITRSGANSMAHLADGIVLVVDTSSTRKQVLQNALYELNVEKEKIAGVVLNKKQQYIPDFIYKRL